MYVDINRHTGDITCLGNVLRNWVIKHVMRTAWEIKETWIYERVHEKKLARTAKTKADEPPLTLKQKTDILKEKWERERGRGMREYGREGQLFHLCHRYRQGRCHSPTRRLLRPLPPTLLIFLLFPCSDSGKPTSAAPLSIPPAPYPPTPSSRSAGRGWDLGRRVLRWWRRSVPPPSERPPGAILLDGGQREQCGWVRLWKRGIKFTL